jgi:uncharacterized protein (TIGR01777 family)
MRVFLTGATGQIGTRLVSRLVSRGDGAIVLTRRPAVARERFGSAVTAVEGDPLQRGNWMSLAADCDGVINLVGENLFARRWNANFKRLLVDSRVKSTQNVVSALAGSPRRGDGTAKVLVNASATGIYGPHGDEELDEDSPAGNDFLSSLCGHWEAAAQAADTAGVRCVRVRIGIVLDAAAGALKKLLTPFKLGLGGPIGDGRQWLSWIHHDDLVSLFLLALDNSDARGALNGTAPNPVTNREFGKALGRALHRPAFMPTPGFAMRLALGEVADVITTGQRVLPKRSLSFGMNFRFPTIDAALADILR